MPHELVAETFEPNWYDRDDGRIGQTYLQGMQFCTDQSSNDGKRHICPLSGWLFFCSAFFPYTVNSYSHSIMIRLFVHLAKLQNQQVA